MHESSLQNRESAYRFILLSILQVPNLLENSDTTKLLQNLQTYWEHLYFIEKDENKPLNLFTLAIELAFRLGKPQTIFEIITSITKQKDLVSLENALFALLELGVCEMEDYLFSSKSILPPNEYQLLEIPFLSQTKPFDTLLTQLLSQMPKTPSKKEMRTLIYLLRGALLKNEAKNFPMLFEGLKKFSIELHDKEYLDSIYFWHLLLEKNLTKAEDLITNYSVETLTNENSFLFFPYGCFLFLTEGEEISKIHFSKILDTPYPPITSIGAHYLLEKINDKKGWIDHAFDWEKKSFIFSYTSTFPLLKIKKSKRASKNF